MQNGPGFGNGDHSRPRHTAQAFPARSSRGVSSGTVMPSPALSIVTSMYQSAASLREFCERAAAAAARLTEAYEIVLVNDGSPDDSLAIALDLRRRDPRIKVLDLSRNFGHHKALMTGLAKATGELVFLIDCDLEEDPAWLGTFHQRLRAGG